MCAGEMYAPKLQEATVARRGASQRSPLENSTLEGDRRGPTKRYARAEAREQSRACLVRARVRVR